MTTPTTTNKTATTIGNVLASLTNAGVQAVEALIIADQPEMGVPGIKQLWELPFAFFASYFIQAEKQGITFAVIDVQVGGEESGISKELAALIAAEKSGNAQAVQTAIKDYQLAQSALINSDGSASS